LPVDSVLPGNLALEGVEEDNKENEKICCNQWRIQEFLVGMHDPEVADILIPLHFPSALTRLREFLPGKIVEILDGRT